MNSYIVVFPNTHPTTKSAICRTTEIYSAEDKNEITNFAITETPMGYPYFIIDVTTYDDIFHDTYIADWSNPDGYGSNSKILKSLKDAGFTDWV